MATSTHAIQQATAAIVFKEAMPTLLARRVVDALREPARILGMRGEGALNTVLIAITPTGAQTPASDAQAGTVFQRTEGQQVVQQLTAARDRLSLQTHAYTRWVGFRDQIAAIVRAALPLVRDAVGIQQLSLEYTDLFWARELGTPDVGMVVNPQSMSICNSSFKSGEPWHSHSGWFEAAGEQRRLVNVDVSVADLNGPPGLRRVATIRTFEALIARDDGDGILPSNEQAVMDEFDALHASLKERMRSVLTHEAAAMISLGH
jgi:uncharacterized protein (TIGR04255 family)